MFAFFVIGFIICSICAIVGVTITLIFDIGIILTILGVIVFFIPLILKGIDKISNRLKNTFIFFSFSLH